jgi:hypothetical protein
MDPGLGLLVGEKFDFDQGFGELYVIDSAV